LSRVRGAGSITTVRSGVAVPRARAQHAAAHGSTECVDVSLGASELLRAIAILPFMLYRRSGFGTTHYVMPRTANWVVDLAALGLIIAS